MEEGIIKITPDKEKAKAPIKMEDITLKRISKTNKEKFPSNTLTDQHNVIRNLLEAITSKEGIKIKGEGAHINIINHICKKHEIKESKRQFIQELRDYRNRTYYEGFNIKKEYVNTNEERIKEIITTLKEILN